MDEVKFSRSLLFKDRLQISSCSHNELTTKYQASDETFNHPCAPADRGKDLQAASESVRLSG